MGATECQFSFRVRYGETDQMGSYYNSRALEWFEMGRSELSRAMGLPYTEWEARGVFMPLVEAHVHFRGRASYDELLIQTVRVEPLGRIRLQFNNTIIRAVDQRAVCDGYTVHALVNKEGRPLRMPDWVKAFFPAGIPG
jgi:acyl-CoA thioester hydrolase